MIHLSGLQLFEFARRRLGANGDIKVLALVVAALSIFAIRSSLNVVRVFSVPVTAVCSDEQSIVTGVSPQVVSVRLRGSQEQLDAFDPAGLSFTLPVESDGTQQEKKVPVRKGVLRGAAPLRRVSTDVGTEDGTVLVSFDNVFRWATTNLVAAPVLLGRPMQARAVVSLPENLAVDVLGPRRRLNEFRAKGFLLPTEPINVEGRTTSFTTEVAIRIPADAGIESVSPSVVMATVEILPNAPVAVETPIPVPFAVEREPEPVEDMAPTNGVESP